LQDELLGARSLILFEDDRYASKPRSVPQLPTTHFPPFAFWSKKKSVTTVEEQRLALDKELGKTAISHSCSESCASVVD
jgi:hypothetical protein